MLVAAMVASLALRSMLVGDTLGIAPVRKKLDAGGVRATTTAGGGRQKPPSSAPATALPAEVAEPGDDDVE